MTIVVQISLSFLSGDTSWGWSITFLCFLQMCFFFVGQGTYQLRREIVELRTQIANLQNNPATAPPRS